MTIYEFVDKVHKILSMTFGYTYKSSCNIDCDEYSWAFDFDPDNTKGVCPSSLIIKIFNSKSRVQKYKEGTIGLCYTSVLYHITPTGNHSLTTKSFDTYTTLKKLEKFKYENLYKWAECQKGTYNNYTQIMKMKDIEKRIKELNKDFVL